MDEEINATEASRRYGISDKTIREWIKEGLLSARHITKTKLAIRVEDIENVAKARGYLKEATRNDLEAEIAELKVAIAILEGRVASLERDARITIPRLRPEDLDSSTYKAAASPTRNSLPEGCILISKFAEMHGVKRSTWRCHVEDGLGPDKEKLETTSRPKPGRPHETERYLDTDLQKAAILFWVKWRVSFSQCKTILCECHNLK